MKKTRKPKEKIKKTTISLAWMIWEMAQEMMKARGLKGDFSNYVRELIWDDKKRLESQPPKTGGEKYPPHKPSRLEWNEPGSQKSP